MNAKRTDLGRVQEIYDVVTQTKRQIAAIGMTRERFVTPANDTEDLAAEGVMNRVFRIAEETGYISDPAATRYGFDTVGARGVRNRLAHAYGNVDRELIWQVVETDFDKLLAACHSYCENEGVTLPLPERPWQA